MLLFTSGCFHRIQFKSNFYTNDEIQVWSFGAQTSVWSTNFNPELVLCPKFMFWIPIVLLEFKALALVFLKA